MLISLLISGAITGFGSYYAIKYDIAQIDYRLTIEENKTQTLENTVNSIRLKDSGDTVAFANVCESLKEIKAQLSEIRKDQVRRGRETK